MTNTSGSEGQPDGSLKPSDRKKRHGMVGGVILICIGLLFLLENIVPGFDVMDYWPLILVAIGGTILWNARSSLQ